MRSIIRLFLGMSALILVWSATAAPADLIVDPAAAEMAKYKAKLLSGQYIPGKLTALDVDKDEKSFTVQVPYQIRTPNAEGQKKYNEVYQQYAAAYRAGNAGEVQRLYAALAEAYQAAFDVEDKPIDFELLGTSKLVVRRLTLPPKEPGDDGRPARYTAKELAELKGDAKLIGYKATLKDLETDQYVRVYIDKSKLKAPAKSKDKDAPPPEEPSYYPITMIVIVPEPMPMLPGNPLLGK
jgi:hypothetical protein